MATTHSLTRSAIRRAAEAAERRAAKPAYSLTRGADASRRSQYFAAAGAVASLRAACVAEPSRAAWRSLADFADGGADAPPTADAYRSAISYARRVASTVARRDCLAAVAVIGEAAAPAAADARSRRAIASVASSAAREARLTRTAREARLTRTATKTIATSLTIAEATSVAERRSAAAGSAWLARAWANVAAGSADNGDYRSVLMVSDGRGDCEGLRAVAALRASLAAH